MKNNDIRLKRKLHLKIKKYEATDSFSGTNPPGPTRPKRWLWLLISVAIIAVASGLIIRHHSDDKQLIANNLPSSDQTSSTGNDTVTVSVDALLNQAGTSQNDSTDDAVLTDGQSSGTSETGEHGKTDSEATLDDKSGITNKGDNNPVDGMKPTYTVSDDVEAEALRVIRGEYGNGAERKRLLGDKYAAIQNRVNELKRHGAF